MTGPRTAILEGFCDGGPYAGRQMANVLSKVRVAILCNGLPDPLAKDYMPNAGPKIVDGWHIFDEGAWRWQTDDGEA